MISAEILSERVRRKVAENLSMHLKGRHTDSHFLGTQQALTLGFSRETEAREVPQTYRKRLSCVVSEQGLEGRPPLPVC